MRKKIKLLCICSAMLFVVIACLIYRLDYLSARSPVSFNQLAAGLHHWFIERKLKLQKSLNKTSTLLADKKVEEEPIQFEFYTTLPNMKVAEADSPPTSNAARVVKSTVTSEDELEAEFKQHLNELKRETKK